MDPITSNGGAPKVSKFDFQDSPSFTNLSVTEFFFFGTYRIRHWASEQKNP